MFLRGLGFYGVTILDADCSSLLALVGEGCAVAGALC